MGEALVHHSDMSLGFLDHRRPRRHHLDRPKKYRLRRPPLTKPSTSWALRPYEGRRFGCQTAGGKEEMTK